ncbi:MAG: alpha/beta fold hydrolase [Pseudomonadota bacterium]|nr:alpha/beta fold hydrolase [Pseudomonadota bacterium]
MALVSLPPVFENDYYTTKTQSPFEHFDLGNFALEEGGVLRNCKLAYKTFGSLNAAKDNAVLFPHMFSGTHMDMEIYVGEGLALDPDKYFVILPDQIGGGISTSPHNTPPPEGMSGFPHVRIGDDIRAQHQLVTEKFGIKTLELVLGWSMGAQQTYEWAVRYPDMVKRAAPIAGTAKNTDHDRIFTQTLMDAITSDPAWNGGEYREPHAVHVGLRRHARLWAVMGLSTEFYHYKEPAWRRLGAGSVEDFIAMVFEKWFAPMDPNALLCMAWKWQRGDVSRNTGGDLKAVLGRIKAKTFVLPFASDMFFPVSDCAYEQSMIPNSELRPIPSAWGHFAMLGVFEEDKAAVNRHIADLLATGV